MRVVKHEDGWIYGLFCTKRKEPDAPKWYTSSAVAACGIARTKELKTWERLDDLKTKSPQQRNVVLHLEFINGDILIYYISLDTRVHVGKSTVDKMLNYVFNTPEDPLRSTACVEQRKELIKRNLEMMRSLDNGGYYDALSS